MCAPRVTRQMSRRYSHSRHLAGMGVIYTHPVLFLYFADRASQYIYLNINQLDTLNFMSLFHASTCFEQHVLSQPVHGTATYRCDDIRGCIVQFWPPDDKHVCSKHVEA